MDKAEEPWPQGLVSRVTCDLQRVLEGVMESVDTFPSDDRSKKLLSFCVEAESSGLFLLLKSICVSWYVYVRYPKAFSHLQFHFAVCVESGRHRWGEITANKARFKEGKAREQRVCPYETKRLFPSQNEHVYVFWDYRKAHWRNRNHFSYHPKGTILNMFYQN